MNNIKPVTRQQENAATHLSEWFDSVLVGTPNDHGNLTLTAYNGDLVACRWIVTPLGGLIYKHLVHPDARKATLSYLTDVLRIV